MSTVSKQSSFSDVVQERTDEIRSHHAWYADLSGTEAEIILRDKADMTYLLRQGEKEGHFYLTYVKNECEFTHIPFIFNHSLNQWFYRQGYPRFAPTLDLFIPEIMHAVAEDCKPLVSLDKM